MKTLIQKITNANKWHNRATRSGYGVQRNFVDLVCRVFNLGAPTLMPIRITESHPQTSHHYPIDRSRSL